jgi:DNA modification methylase
VAPPGHHLAQAESDAGEHPRSLHQVPRVLFLLAKSERYYYDANAIKERASDNTHARRKKNMPAGWATDGPHDTVAHQTAQRHRKVAPIGSGTKNNTSFDVAMTVMPDERNKRSVWSIATEPFPEAHFATFPMKLVEPCILAGCPPRGVVLDPFGGSGTTGLVAERLERDAILIELNTDYADMAERRIRAQTRPLPFAEAGA